MELSNWAGLSRSLERLGGAQPLSFRHLAATDLLAPAVATAATSAPTTDTIDVTTTIIIAAVAAAVVVPLRLLSRMLTLLLQQALLILLQLVLLPLQLLLQLLRTSSRYYRSRFNERQEIWTHSGHIRARRQKSGNFPVFQCRDEGWGLSESLIYTFSPP